MKTRTLLRTGIYLILILFLLLLGILVWPGSPQSPEAIAKRGLTAPDTSLSVTDPATWRTSYGSPRDWMDQGMDAFVHWDHSPWKNKEAWFGRHLYTLQHSEDLKDQAEYRKLLKLGREWHERILARYPELAIRYRDVPDDQNGLLRWMGFLKTLKKTGPHSYDFKFPDTLSYQMWNQQPFDADASRFWLDANRTALNELRAIGLMSDRSAKRIDSGDVSSYTARGCANALLLDARLAAYRGDAGHALESIRAANGLANHFLNSEAVDFSQGWDGSFIQQQIRNCVFTSILPVIPGDQVNLVEWENALNPVLQQPADFANSAKAQWNAILPEYLLPLLSDNGETEQPPDPDALVESLTRYALAAVQQNQNLSLTDLPANPNPDFDSSGLSWRSRKLTQTFGIAGASREFFEHAQLRTGMTQAAFAILKGQPVPNDPIYGKPYSWNPETRELSLPAGDEFERKGVKPLILPKL